MAGWICLHRDIQDHWIFKDAERFKAWVDMIMLANHEPKKFMINNSLIICERGQLAYSQLSLADRWKWSRQKTRTFLQLLKNESMIDIKTNQHTSIITICNYSVYQDKQPTAQPTDSQQIANAQPTLNQQITTTKQINNVNNVNNVNNKQIISSSFQSEDIVLQQKIPYQEIVNLYQQTLPELPAVLKITDKRKASIKKLWSSDPGINDLDSFGEYFKHIKKIQFLNGQNDRGWTADFDFLVNPTNFLKIIEGKYK